MDERRDYPTTSTSAFGRVFYGMNNRVMFSRVVVDDIDALGRCHQRNDPSSSENPDILATDGGDIPIQNAGRVSRIEEFQQGVLVFADNGVWYVYGPQSGFTATDYSVKKITDFTLISPRATVNVGSALFFASESGIHSIGANEFGELKEQMISEQKVDDYIQGFVSEDLIAEYDDEDKQIVWVNPKDNRWVIQDLRLGSWYPQKFESSKTHSGILSIYQDQYFVVQEDGKYALADLSDESFRDYGTEFDAYLVTAYETTGDFTKKKGVPLLSAYFAKTEENITGYSDGSYEFDKPSGCLLSVRWDWHTSDSGGKWSRPQQMYNPLPRGYIPEQIPVQFDTGASVVSKTTKVRGTGNAIQVRFEKQPGKDMRLLGYSMVISSKGRQ